MQSQERRFDPAGLVVAALLAVLAGVIVWDMSTLQITQTYGVGPKAMPIVVAVGLALLAVGNLVLAFRHGFPEREQAAHLPIVLILGGLAAVIVVIGIGGGFIISMTILFTATAAAFRGGLPEREQSAYLPIVLILGGLAVVIVLIGIVLFGIGSGFILSMTILIATTAAAFARRTPVDLAIGFVLGTGAYLMFAKLLSLSLPMGPLERLL